MLGRGTVRSWTARQPLRVRLTALLVALLLLACAAVGVATYLVLRGFLLNRLDQQLSAASARYAAALTDPDHDTDNAETTTVGQAVGTLSARTLDGQITSIGVITDNNESPHVTTDTRAAVEGVRPSTHSRSVELPGLGAYRIVAVSEPDGGVLITGLPQEPVDETLRHLVLSELIIFAVVLAIIGVLGALAVRWSLRPLSRVATTAGLVARLRLDSEDVRLRERVPSAPPETEVGKVSTAFNHMLDRIDAALEGRNADQQRLRSFLADASHELRTPLAVVRAHAELAQRDRAEMSPMVADSLRRIESETKRMGSVVDDLLLLARLDTGRPLERAEVDLSRLAIDAITDSQAAGRDHHWGLELPDEPVVLTGDRDRLHQVLANLLANARIHTPPDTTIRLTVRTLPDRAVEVVVADDGPGIPSDLLPRVMERFVHGDSNRSQDQGSTGLGLSIVSGVVAAHRGRVAIAGSPGTTVTIQLPEQ